MCVCVCVCVVDASSRYFSCWGSSSVLMHIALLIHQHSPHCITQRSDNNAQSYPV